MRQQQQTPSEQLNFQNSTAILIGSVRCISTCFTVFSRHTFGPEGLGWPAFGAFLFILLFAGTQNAPEVLLFFWVWVVALIMQRIRTFWAIERGYVFHSQFQGWPWLGFLLPWVRTYRQAKAWEMVLCGVIAVVVAPFSEQVASLLICASLALLIDEGIDRHMETMERRRLMDAELELRARSRLKQDDSYGF